MIIAPGSISVSGDIQVVDDVGLPVLGLLAGTMPQISWSLNNNTAPVPITLSDLAALTTAYTSGGVKEKSGGYYRLDLPNNAVLTAGEVRIIGEASGKHVISPPIIISPSLTPTGNFAVTLNWLDGSAVAVGNVTFNILVAGVTVGSGISNGSGTITFGLNNGTYSIVSRTTSGVVFANDTFTVNNGTVTRNITGSTVILPASSDPALSTAFLDCYTPGGSLVSGVTLHYQLIKPPSGIAMSFDVAPSVTPASDVNGRITVDLMRSATYLFWRGSGSRHNITVQDAATTTLPIIVDALK